MKRNTAWIKFTAAAVLVSLLLLCTDLPASGAQRVSASPDEVVVPILMYHELKYNKLGKDVIAPWEFERDLRYLSASGYTSVSMKDLIDYAEGTAGLPEKPVMLTFDDGYLNTYYYALPLLKKFHMKMVFSIIGKNTDDFTRVPDSSLDYSHVTWDQLNEMISTGLVEVQNHTYDLHQITRGRYGCQKKSWETMEHYDQTLTEDIGGLQQEILLKTGFLPSTFTYPYGKVSRESLPVLLKLGFRASLTCDYGLNYLSRDPSRLFGLKRICRAHGETAQKLLEEADTTRRFHKPAKSKA